MNKAIRWRIMTLQAVLVVVLAAVGGFAFAMGSFTTSQIRDELTAQQIYFPGQDQIKSGGALDPAEFQQEIRDQAGNQVTDGNQARIYANDFIGKHLQGVAKGQTYAQVSGAAIALQGQIAQTPKTDPNYSTMQQQLATLNAQKQTLFMGETLRSSLLNAYGWWTVGTYAIYAGLALIVVALGVLGAFAFEVVAAREPKKVFVTKKAAA